MQDQLPFEEFQFNKVELEAVQNALQKNLGDYFATVNVEIVDCPDFSEAPFNLATKGFGGGETGILDLGGVPYLVPLVDRTRIYDLAKIVPKYIGAESQGFPNGFYISGPAAGPWPSQGTNSEMIVNMFVGKDGEMIQNKSRVALISGKNEEGLPKVLVKVLGLDEPRCALLANLMVSSGIPGKVLRIKCTKRIDPKISLTGSIRSCLLKEFGTDPVGLVGLFLVQNSKSRIHVMPNFSSDPLSSDKDVDNWLRYFPMDPPMLFQSVLISKDPGLDLRVEHSHGWSLSEENEAGHYHYDLSPETVEYVAYYSLAQKIWRIDRPESTHPVGRD